MSKVVPLKIDTDLGKLPLKEKGLDMIDFKSTEELRRNQLEKLVAGFRLFSYFERLSNFLFFSLWSLK